MTVGVGVTSDQVFLLRVLLLFHLELDRIAILVLAAVEYLQVYNYYVYPTDVNKPFFTTVVIPFRSVCIGSFIRVNDVQYNHNIRLRYFHLGLEGVNVYSVETGPVDIGCMRTNYVRPSKSYLYIKENPSQRMKMRGKRRTDTHYVSPPTSYIQFDLFNCHLYNTSSG